MVTFMSVHYEKMQNAMHPDTFRKVLMTALFLMALNLIRRGLF